MKTVLMIFLLVAMLAGNSDAKPTHYYWVVETNTCKNNFSIILIYDNNHALIYTEQVEKNLDITDRKINRMLNRKARKLKALKEK